MRKTILTETQKEHLATLYLKWHKAVLRGNRITQDQLADAYQVSRRTIQRALIEQGAIPPYKTKGTKLATVPPAPVSRAPQTERPEQGVRTLEAGYHRYVNIYANGPSPVMHMTHEQALRNKSLTKPYRKTVRVEIPA